MKQLFQLFRVEAVEAKLTDTGFPYETLIYFINHIIKTKVFNRLIFLTVTSVDSIPYQSNCNW